MQIGSKTHENVVKETYTVTREHKFYGDDPNDTWLAVEEWRDKDGNMHNMSGPAHIIYEHDGNPDNITKIISQSWYIRGHRVGVMFHPDEEQGEIYPEGFKPKGFEPT